MSATIANTDAVHEQAPEFDADLQIRLGDTVEQMRVRFDEFVLNNPDLVVEQEPSGEITIMSPAGAAGSSLNSEIAMQIGNWSRQFGGKVFDSSAMFVFASGAKRSPDAAWIAIDRWLAIPSEDRKRFPPIAPDFVLELRSETGRLPELTQKMQEYIANGVRLAWLVDPLLKQVHVYQTDLEPIVLSEPANVSGGDVLPGFELDTKRIFSDSP